MIERGLILSIFGIGTKWMNTKGFYELPFFFLALYIRTADGQVSHFNGKDSCEIKVIGDDGEIIEILLL